MEAYAVGLARQQGENKIRLLQAAQRSPNNLAVV